MFYVNSLHMKCLDPIINGIQNIATLKEKFYKRFNFLEQTGKEQFTYWDNMKSITMSRMLSSLPMI